MAVLHKNIAGQDYIAQKVSDLEIDIRTYINHAEDFDSVIAEDARWEIFYHLTSMRISLFNWYEFKEDAELLEIGAGFGALTGLFCERCAHVTTVERSVFRAESIHERYSDKDNLDIYAGRIEEIDLVNKFDYIVLVGVLENICRGSSSKEEYAKFLQQISHFLKPDGKVLLAVENRYGLRYFCGAIEPYTGKPFDGINHYPNGTTGYSFSRQELIDILNLSGLGHHKFYYPLPDYKLPQLIYSEDFLPQSKLSERLIPYYVNQSALIAIENEIYDDLVDNHVFEFFSNSFLVECALDAEFCSVIFAAVSTDRGQKHGFATTIHNNDVVFKRPLFAKGQESIRTIYDNLKNMREHGISVVPHSLEQSGLCMPFVHDPTLSDYLGIIVDKDKEIFIGLIDKLYDCILHSSEHVPAEQNTLCDDMKDNADFGIILRKAYIDMVPFNCFYTEGNLVFFDQEFVRDNYPAKYVLFRALKYIYLAHPSAENEVPLKLLQEKYSLTKLWSLFEKEENQFVAENRKYDVYKNFYTWTKVDRRQISKNSDALLEGEFGYDREAIEKLQGIHEVQLELLKVFQAICEKNGLRYFAVHGTLLGAIRHKGFIPWDDDVDMAMPREDYEKLKLIAKDVFREPYFFQSNENDQEVFRGSLSRLRNSNTTGIEYTELGQSGNLGIWIDILALDFIYADPFKRNKQLESIQFYQRLLLTKTYGVDFREYEDFTWEKRKLSYNIARLLSRKWLLRQFYKACSICQEDEAGYVGTFTRYTNKENIKLIDRQFFQSSVLVDFEQLKLPAPVGYQKYLSIIIGNNFMKYPPMVQRTPHHPGIFHADISYLRFTGTFRNTRDKKFVIFGSGQMFDHYMQNYGQKYSPSFLVDNDQAKWNTKKHGIQIKSPEELLTLKMNETRLIICSIYYRDIGEQLEQMGIREYYIYIQNKEWL